MPSTSDINTTALSGLNYIDALLSAGPDWNYLTGTASNTLAYTFSTASGTERNASSLGAFTTAQQADARSALAYVSSVTGIKFVETAVGTDAQFHFAYTDLDGPSTVGLCVWKMGYGYNPSNNALTSYDADAYVYLDNAEWKSATIAPVAGSGGYQTLLHEIGHALGLKHPFDGDIKLPSAEDNTSNTLMSYTGQGGPYAAYGQDDIAALNWLYGGDGLGGACGLDAATRYVTGTGADDTLNSAKIAAATGGNYLIDGAGGNDSVVFGQARSAYTVTKLGNGNLQVIGPAAEGTAILKSVETLVFADGSVAGSALGGSVTPPGGSTGTPGSGTTSPGSGTSQPGGVTTTPTVPKASFTLDSNSNKVVFSGSGDAGNTIKLVGADGTSVLGKTTVMSNGSWHVDVAPLPNGHYAVSVAATDAAGHVTSAASPMNFTIASTDNLIGTSGNDRLAPTAALNVIDGLDGFDVVSYAGARAGYKVHAEGDGYTVTDASGQTDLLLNVERVQFSDHHLVALDASGNAGQVYRLYGAAFDRTPDAGGLSFWIDAVDKGETLNQVAGNFLQSKEALDLYAGTSDAQFVAALYQHVLHRAGDAAGVNFWVDSLKSITRADTLAFFSESPENQAKIVGFIHDGIDYAQWGAT